MALRLLYHKKRTLWSGKPKKVENDGFNLFPCQIVLTLLLATHIMPTSTEKDSIPESLRTSGTTPLSCGPEARQFERIVPERAAIREHYLLSLFYEYCDYRRRFSGCQCHVMLKGRC